MIYTVYELDENHYLPRQICCQNFMKLLCRADRASIGCYIIELLMIGSSKFGSQDRSKRSDLMLDSGKVDQANLTSCGGGDEAM